jgi:hypothetical protein
LFSRNDRTGNGKTALFLSGIMLKNVHNVKMNIRSIPFIFQAAESKMGMGEMVVRPAPEANNVRIFSEPADRRMCQSISD